MTNSPYLTETSEGGIRACFAALLAQRKYDDAWQVATDCKDFTDGDMSNTFSQALLDDKNTPMLVKAKAMSRLAQLTEA
jgi:hypothetical protein